MIAASAWGAERVPWSSDWRIGAADGQQKFRGRELSLKWRHERFAFEDCL